MIKLSFIIPFYNGKKYIEECIASICCQNIEQSNIEILVVDDCSDDEDSILLLENLQHSHNNLHLIRNTFNRRCGYCRNNGVQHATGDYIWFVDQDDCIAPNCIKDILMHCYNNSLDILYFDFRTINDDLSINCKCNVVTNKSSVMSGLDYIEKLCDCDFWKKGYDTNVWHSVYRRKFLIENNIYSPEVSYCEDMIVAQHAIICANRFMSYPYDYYYYRINPKSVYHTEVGINGRPLFDSSVYAGYEIIKLAEIIPNKYEKLRLIVKNGGVFRINSFTKQILTIKLKQRMIFFETISKYYNIVFSSKMYMTSINQWIISHPKYVIHFPHVIYFIIKMLNLNKLK